MSLYDLKKELDKSGIMMCFNGSFSHSIIEETGKAIRTRLTAGNVTPMAVMDVFAVYVELAQNVSNYQIVREMTDSEAKSSIITIAKNGNMYIVSSGNMVLHEDRKTLLSSIEEVNGMTPEERKRKMREVLRREHAPDALGAGIGFLEIAKRSSEKIACDFQAVDDTFGFFTLTAFV